MWVVLTNTGEWREKENIMNTGGQKGEWDCVVFCATTPPQWLDHHTCMVTSAPTCFAWAVGQIGFHWQSRWWWWGGRSNQASEVPQWYHMTTGSCTWQGEITWQEKEIMKSQDREKSHDTHQSISEGLIPSWMPTVSPKPWNDSTTIEPYKGDSLGTITQRLTITQTYFICWRLLPFTPKMASVYWRKKIYSC